MTVAQAVEATIESIAAGGDGVARVGGMVVFVPRTAPGDVVDLAIESRGRFGRGRMVALRVPSPARVGPSCRHYDADRCGGCQIQHLSYPAQLDAKATIVRDALRRIARRPVDMPTVRPAPSPWRYRRKLTLALRAQGSGRWIAGLHPYDDPASVFPLEECPITEDRVLAVWRDVLDAGDALPRAAALRGAVRFDEANQASLVIEGGTEWRDPSRLLDRVSSLDAVWWTREGARAARRVASRRADEEPAASFAQVNTAVAAELRRHVVDVVLGYHPDHVLDAYAGTGETALALATPARRVTAIELDVAASAWCAERLPPGSRAIAGRVERELEAALPADVVVLNPPRAGVDAEVPRVLERQTRSVRAIVYVSCDPATLARDLGRLPSWRIASLVSFDMFPQTAHVETVCTLVPETA